MASVLVQLLRRLAAMNEERSSPDSLRQSIGINPLFPPEAFSLSSPPEPGAGTFTTYAHPSSNVVKTWTHSPTLTVTSSCRARWYGRRIVSLSVAGAAVGWEFSNGLLSTNGSDANGSSPMRETAAGGVGTGGKEEKRESSLLGLLNIALNVS